MLRQYCPWCNQLVNLCSSDQIKAVNGRGMYRTEIYAHRSCYERWKENRKHEKMDTVKNN